MKISAIETTKVPPIKKLAVSELSDVVVFAGPNGVGKTRLIGGLIAAFTAPQQKLVRLTLEATCMSEREEWGKERLDLANDQDIARLNTVLHANRRRAKCQSSVFYFESDRTIQRVKPVAFSWDVADPWTEEVGWNMTLNELKQRFQDTMHSLFRKTQNRRFQIASDAERELRNGRTELSLLSYPDPLKKFKEAFSQLLAPKVLLDPNPRTQRFYYRFDGGEHDIDTLSSGEREVVNIVFDFLLRSPEDSIVFFDEPELHLHPELSYRLLNTLASVGGRNQFIFCTHSPDIITASLENSVVFISPPTGDPSQNQAITVSSEDETNEALKLLGQSIGIVSLGRKLVLIEGANASLDKQTYGAILRGQFPDLVLVPSGGKDLIRSFAQLQKDVLDQTIWGVEFFMLCDRDSLPASRTAEELMEKSNGKLRSLAKYHLENYFLDEAVIAELFQTLEPEGSWLRSPEQVREKLIELARELVPYATTLVAAAELRIQVGNVDLNVKQSTGAALNELVTAFTARKEQELSRVASALETASVEELVRDTYATLEKALTDGSDTWKSDIPGRPLFNKFANRAKMTPDRLRRMYIAAAAGTDAFAQLLEHFLAFDGFTRPSPTPKDQSQAASG